MSEKLINEFLNKQKEVIQEKRDLKTKIDAMEKEINTVLPAYKTIQRQIGEIEAVTKVTGEKNPSDLKLAKKRFKDLGDRWEAAEKTRKEYYDRISEIGNEIAEYQRGADLLGILMLDKEINELVIKSCYEGLNNGERAKLKELYNKRHLGATQKRGEYLLKRVVDGAIIGDYFIHFEKQD